MYTYVYIYIYTYIWHSQVRGESRGNSDSEMFAGFSVGGLTGEPFDILLSLLALLLLSLVVVVVVVVVC